VTPQFERQLDEPLFPNVLYARPVTRVSSGRLLLLGGHSGSFSDPTAFHELALAAGIGECRVLLPDVLAKILSGAPGTYFAASSPSGSLGREAADRAIELSEEADVVAIGADLSNNSDTGMLIERLLTQLDRPIAVFGDALHTVLQNPKTVTDNATALVILTMAEVFKLAGKLQIPINVRPGAGLINKLEIIQDLKSASRCGYVVYGTEIIVAQDTHFIVTPIDFHLSTAPQLFYATLATFWTQNPSRRREGLATGAYLIRAAQKHLPDISRPSLPHLSAALRQAVRQSDS
jgi:NAD(P)H-hydrate repair Nnr-like enzyme with NAD(P)H-hydrate dehydratase domain